MFLFSVPGCGDAEAEAKKETLAQLEAKLKAVEEEQLQAVAEQKRLAAEAEARRTHTEIAEIRTRLAELAVDLDHHLDEFEKGSAKLEQRMLACLTVHEGLVKLRESTQAVIARGNTSEMVMVRDSIAKSIAGLESGVKSCRSDISFTERHLSSARITHRKAISLQTRLIQLTKQRVDDPHKQRIDTALAAFKRMSDQVLELIKKAKT